MFLGHRRPLSDATSGEGEGYLASSADLMIGILFIFIIMVVYLAVEIKRVEAEGSRKTDPLKALVSILGAKLQASGVKVELDPDSGVIALPADALFDKGQSTPRDGAMESIVKTNDILSEIVPCYVRSKSVPGEHCKDINQLGVLLETIMVEGHTDSDQYANDPDRNWHLGLDRARYIFNVFGRGALGVLRNDKGQPLLGVSSYADSRPAAAGNVVKTSAPDTKAKDRRVELRFILSYQGGDATGSARGLIEQIKER
jgi:chemotaxis protein MotB